MTEQTIATAQDEHESVYSPNGEDHWTEDLDDILSDDEELKAGDSIHVGVKTKPSISFLCDADDVIEQIASRAYDVGGEYAEDYPEVSKEARAELDALLEAWITKHCPPHFYTVEDVKPYVLTAADFDVFPKMAE